VESAALDLDAGGDEIPDAAGTLPWNLEDSIRAKLEASRKDLLDLGLRNSLLNYRLLRARGVEVVDELSTEIFRILARQGRAMAFLPVGDDLDPGNLAQPDDSGSIAARHTDLRLQTSASPTQLQSRLLATYRAAHTSLEEQGVNTLFLALGMLHWYEEKNAPQVRRAPLLLVPASLERSNVTERFRLRYTGDDISFNPSLTQKLRTEFGITMPAMGEADDLDLAVYFVQVAEAIRGQPAWKVVPNDIALGFFSFAKMLMYEDLDAERWPKDLQPVDAPILRALLQEQFSEPPSPYSEDALLDQEHPESTTLPLVMDADSSQSLAILDVMAGRNLVIQGPPGTGKSQTIANLIAQAVAGGKTVLFVAEKLAALDVVKRRLDRVGLGDACLPLHSHNTQKKALLAELRRTLELGKPRQPGSIAEREDLDRSRAKLNTYATAVNTPIGESGVTPHDALGRIVRLGQLHAPETLHSAASPDMHRWSASDYRRRLGIVTELQVQLKAVGPAKSHPFWGSRRTAFPPTERESVWEILDLARQANEQVVLAARRLADMLGVQHPTQLSEVEPLLPKDWQLARRWFGKDKPARQSLEGAIARRATQLAAVSQALQLDEQQGVAAAVDSPFPDTARQLNHWMERLPELQSLAALNHAIEQCRRGSLEAFADLAHEMDGASTDLTAALQYSWFTSLIRQAYAERAALAQFNRLSHEQALDQFRALDQETIRANSSHLAEKHWKQLPTHTGGGQLAVLKREFEKKSRHLPLRQLMTRAGMPIQKIKPVFMMSPLSIANYIPPGSLSFDLAIFDEASQVKPVDAFGALLRTKQAVVVGDNRQLPPTSFFDALTKGEEMEEENVTADMESILGLFAAQLAPQRMLRWHYRSRHESLIAVSNHAFYDDRLIVFPSPDGARTHSGLIYHHLEESSYDRGGSRANLAEAQVVARAVMKHARKRPNLTLGVAAFSMAQMQAIADQVELLRREDTGSEAFFTTEHPHEPFFVKNLETVQGDERDVIFISVGYGRTQEGRLSMSFGPLNADGGERRLNVMITRARLRCEVFTNLRAGDIEEEGKRAGVRAFKVFLNYAETGLLELSETEDFESDPPFEEAVRLELDKRGHTVRQQVGSAGFRVDLAIVDPESPGRYLLGVECDGATYNSAHSARDRDRLREEVLKRLGWRLHRIWSADWLSDPEREILRLESAIENAQRAPEVDDKPEVRMTLQEPQVVREENATPQDTVPISARPYETAYPSVNLRGQHLHAVRHDVVAGWVAEVVSVESPVHQSEVARRIADAAGVKRIGSRIDAMFNYVFIFGLGAHRLTVDRRGEFLWKRGAEQPQVRDRSGLPVASRKLELVAPEEIEAAVQQVVEHSYGMEADQIPVGVCRLLGIGRTTPQMVNQIASAIDRLRASGRLSQKGAYLTVATASGSTRTEPLK
jgi:very-short-patch-repair endonuclease